MKPTKIWKDNKWRSDLRSYTRDFQKKFFLTEKLSLEPGEVYASSYRVDPDLPTDKHHFTPVFVSFGRFRDDQGKTYVRGLNLFYLKTSQKLEVLDEVERLHDLPPDARVAPLIKIHEKWMKITPYSFKNFEERRITGICKLTTEEWGMIPLLREYLYGTFNPIALNEDFQKEHNQSRSFAGKKSPVVPEKDQVIQDEEVNETEAISDSSVISSSMDFDSLDDI